MPLLTFDEVLSLVPQQSPMRFIDRILELDEEHILATYSWKGEDCAGWAPDDRLVPVFKLIEMGAQIGTVAWCIYHMALKTAPEEIRQLVGFFTAIERGSCTSLVHPGDTVACRAAFGEEGYFRGSKIVSEVRLWFHGGPKDGREIFSGVISGLWVPKNSPAAA